VSDSGVECEIVVTRSGAEAMRDVATGELMHPVVGPLVEAATLYVAPSRLRERLERGGAGDPPLVLLDVGLGAGSNAIAAWKVAESVARSARRLEIVSFERSLGALRLAIDGEHGGAFGFEDAGLHAARELAAKGLTATERASWRLVLGELPETLDAEQDLAADVVFWDPFSPRANPELWSARAFRAVRRLCRAGATLHTYSAATATRSALILGGFAVGEGAGTGEGKKTTVAATDGRDLDRPLDRRWLERLQRSSAPFPPDAPPDALARVAEAAQFALG
jgi:queuine tRNA-ribosyltransferase